MNGETDKDDLTQWEKTYEKQRRALLKRQQTQEIISSVTNPLDKVFGACNAPETVKAPTLCPMSPRVAAIATEQYGSPSDPIEAPTRKLGLDDAAPVILTMPVTVTPLKFVTATGNDEEASKGNDEGASKGNDKEASKGNDEEASICNALASINISSPPLHSQNPSGYPVSPPLATATPGKRKKYYVVSTGKCAGVFDSWPYVQSITSGVRGNCQKSYPSYDEAREDYVYLKARNLIRIVRNPGDENVFGPIEKAIQ